MNPRNPEKFIGVPIFKNNDDVDNKFKCHFCKKPMFKKAIYLCIPRTGPQFAICSPCRDRHFPSTQQTPNIEIVAQHAYFDLASFVDSLPIEESNDTNRNVEEEPQSARRPHASNEENSGPNEEQSGAGSSTERPKGPEKIEICEKSVKMIKVTAYSNESSDTKEPGESNKNPEEADRAKDQTLVVMAVSNAAESTDNNEPGSSNENPEEAGQADIDQKLTVMTMADTTESSDKKEPGKSNENPEEADQTETNPQEAEIIANTPESSDNKQPGSTKKGSHGKRKNKRGKRR